MNVRHPEIKVQLTGINGNAFVILGAVSRALGKAGHADEVKAFTVEAMEGDYDHLLRTCMEWVTVS